MLNLSCKFYLHKIIFDFFCKVKNIIRYKHKKGKLSSLGVNIAGILDNLILVDKIRCFVYM